MAVAVRRACLVSLLDLLRGHAPNGQRERRLSRAVAEADAAEAEKERALQEWERRKRHLAQQHGISWEDLLLAPPKERPDD